ncbi:MAG: hypothetical protein M0P59_12725 [Gallionella sp.]|jgi:hypothetical protein|nr:hypothetical protein [Gallionella sp.]MCK9355007.1 hypothetical protein [Gallionella sp.]
MTILPWQAHKDLTEERLSILAEGLLNVRHDTYAELTTRLDDNYSRGCATFGRQRQWLMQQAKSERYDWLTLASPAMDLTVNIGSIPVRFFTDDHDSPKKPGYYKRNDVDQLFSSDDTEPVVFRFVVEPAATLEDEDRVFFLGHNVYQEVVVEWQYRPRTAIILPVGSNAPETVVQSDAEVGLKSQDKEQGGKAIGNNS